MEDSPILKNIEAKKNKKKISFLRIKIILFELTKLINSKLNLKINKFILILNIIHI
jgi:hypothetical protein